MKKEAYLNLVNFRKHYKFPVGLINPSEIKNGIYDQDDHIGPWSKWQGNLDAEIMLIGQDWGDVDFYLKCKGSHIDNSPTNKTLKELFKVIKMDVGYPNTPNPEAPVFFTNAILGLKQGGMNSKIKDSWLINDAKLFLKPTIDIINPKILITLGLKPYEAVAYLYGLKKDKMSNLIKKIPIKLDDGKLLFAMFHCGKLGLVNRKLELQKKDWEKISNYL